MDDDDASPRMDHVCGMGGPWGRKDTERVLRQPNESVHLVRPGGNKAVIWRVKRVHLRKQIRPFTNSTHDDHQPLEAADHKGIRSQN